MESEGEADMVEFMKGLDLVRAALAAEPGASTDEFATRVLGDNDAVQGTARNALAVDLCRGRGIQGQPSGSFSVFMAMRPAEYWPEPGATNSSTSVTWIC